MPGEKKRAKAYKGQAQAARPAALALSKKARRKQRQRGEARPAGSYAYGTRTISRTNAQGLSITVQIPPLRRPKLPKPEQSKGRRRLFRPLMLVPAVAVIVGGVLVGFIFRPVAPKHVATVSAAKRTVPDYAPLVPPDNQANQASYDSTKNLVSYTTTFSDARVTVSEQPLPANFAADGGALKRAADSIDAVQKIDTAHGPFYVALADKDTGQMGIYAGNNVLLFVHADKELNDVTWKSFIDVLQSKDWKNIHN